MIKNSSWSYIPEHINPILFSVGPFQIHWYGLMYVIAFSIFYGLSTYRIRTEKLAYSEKTVLDFLTWAIAGVLLGGRLGYVLFYDFGYFAAHPVQIISPFDFSNSFQYTGIYGMSYHGGMIGVMTAAIFFCRKNKIKFWPFVDFVIPTIPLGYLFGRLGNFMLVFKADDSYNSFKEVLWEFFCFKAAVHRGGGRKTMSLLVLLRHGESQFNHENRFTGWLDVPLSLKGVLEAKEAGQKIKNLNIKFNKAYVSNLKRTHDSLKYVLDVLGEKISAVSTDTLNERHYGDLQGLNKTETAKKFGEEQVKVWRRSYDVAPPNGESLMDTAARVLPYFHSRIMEDMRDGKNVLVIAHGNSLRCIVMELDKLTKEQVMELNIPTGIPMVYEFDHALNIISKKQL